MEQQQQEERPRLEGYFYSPVTDQYYRRFQLDTHKSAGAGKSTLVDQLVGAQGIICGRYTWGETRMMHYQSGRGVVEQ